MTCVILCAAWHLASAQSLQNAMAKEKPAREDAPMYKALFVLRSDFKTVELDPRKNQFFDVKAIDAKYVKYVSILKRREAIKLYGEKGSHGVVIVQFADDYAFSAENFVREKVDDRD